MSPERTLHRARRSDGGFTLPEVLVSVMIIGMIAAVLGAAISITFRQSTNSEGRLNVARAEQSVDTWLPADLASTDINDTDLPGVNLDPAATPCGNCGTIDLSGSNALQLAWKTTSPGSPPIDVITRVQYQYVQRDSEWIVERISCVGSEPCDSVVVLHDLAGPDDPGTYDPNTDRPTWVMDVAVPVPDPSLDLDDNARQVIVTVNGGGSEEGAFGGLNSISLTAGGRSTSEIAADEFTVPSFVRAKSRCGGNISLIVDESGSIGGDMGVVETGVDAFIEAFRGTPTEVQIISFATDAESIHPNPPGGTDPDDGDQWHNYVDMTDETLVDQLKARVPARLDPAGANWYDSGTNWEDAFFRALRDEDGSSASEMPKRIVFFTDGIPTFHRRSSRDGMPSTAVYDGTLVDFNDGHYTHWGYDVLEGSEYNQQGWDRADVLLDLHRDIDLIFVGVGAGLNSPVNWVHNPATYTNRHAAASSATSMQGWETLTYLLANAPTGYVPATTDASGEYTNPETANWYKQENFDATAFANAMKAAALKDCGGTLTIQTRLADGTPVSEEFVYENTEYRNGGVPVDAEPRRVTTSSVFRAGTFDFEFAGGATSFEVDVVPQELETLNDYTPVGWSCRAGADSKSITDIAIDGSSFTGFTVDVAANEAVSCILTVTN